MRTIIIRTIAVVLGLLVGLCLVEFLLRVVLPDSLESTRFVRGFFCEIDPILGWKPVPNLTALFDHGGLSTTVHQNQYGLRAPDSLSQHLSPGTRRIIVLGDSYVWGYGVADEDVFTNMPRRAADPELINFGVAGYGTDQEYLFYERYATDFEAQEVALVFTPYNDVANNMAPKQYGLLKPFFTVDDGLLRLHTEHLRTRPFLNLMRGLRARSRAIDIFARGVTDVEDRFEELQSGDGVSLPRAEPLKPEMVSSADREGVALTVAIIAALRDVVEARGRSFYVVFVPYKPHIQRFAGFNHPLVPIISQELQRRGISYREPYFLFRQHARAGEQLFNEADNHFSPTGHALFRTVLVDQAVVESTTNVYSARGVAGDRVLTQPQ